MPSGSALGWQQHVEASYAMRDILRQPPKAERPQPLLKGSGSMPSLRWGEKLSEKAAFLVAAESMVSEAAPLGSMVSGAAPAADYGSQLAPSLLASTLLTSSPAYERFEAQASSTPLPQIRSVKYAHRPEVVPWSWGSHTFKDHRVNRSHLMPAWGAANFTSQPNCSAYANRR
mmetsp:Transcript_10718/g.17035  ORF Transcript_10718/g.17035 Transcript_10718/m.17035 type:complete len:173 (+) Transcript_10718:67-585(+)|eukprot:CAMPEP_0115086524 /NCGR_PEP_ID=MMETSP0227-20121206/22641_1 /TAXON_ID=89957 /ORGANISM="Polarella glacialis, Strain CCMP 1383" /LENGTH=172 /DNA_ID=CAMNT_0002476007 /DNA_START=58 /DNA_END=576 /DNA_ORIENTATION=+